MKTLLIDDDSFALRILGRQLQRLDFPDFVPVDRATVALELLQQDPRAFDTILLDLQMPELDGIEFVRHLARLGFAGRLVFTSGEDERILDTAVSLARAQGLDVGGALRKPVGSDALRTALQERQQRTPAHARAIVRRDYSAERLAAAIEQRELFAVYQPQVSLRTGALHGFEALVRWRHPEDGIVTPDHFIGLAEEHGLIDALTQVVLESSLGALKRWHASGVDANVSVNISMDSLADLRFPERVAQALANSGVPATLLALEVTESQLMRNPVAALETVSRLRLRHIGLSIDDFGTGHSSLAQLRDMPFDELKIDRSFVHRAASAPASRAILEGSLQMARQLRMRTVGEGVEDQSDWDTLRALGCELAQGYFISRPLDEASIAAWHAEWEQRVPALCRNAAP